MVKKILERLLFDGMINSMVVYHLSEDINLLVSETWFPFMNSSCGKIVENVYKIDECRVTEHFNATTNKTEIQISNSTFNQHLFPRIPRYFNGCFLDVSAFVWSPFVVMKNELGDELTGLELKMLKEITSKMELRIKFKLLEGNPLTRKISYDNKTGIYADLLQK